jgi:hypothetical protein
MKPFNRVKSCIAAGMLLVLRAPLTDAAPSHARQRPMSFSRIDLGGVRHQLGLGYQRPLDRFRDGHTALSARQAGEHPPRQRPPPRYRT